MLVYQRVNVVARLILRRTKWIGADFAACRFPGDLWWQHRRYQVHPSSPPNVNTCFVKELPRRLYRGLASTGIFTSTPAGPSFVLFYSDFFSKAKGNLMGEQVAVAFQPEQLLRLSTESGDVSAVRTIMDNLSIPLTKTQERLELKPKRTKRLA